MLTFDDGGTDEQSDVIWSKSVQWFSSYEMTEQKKLFLFNYLENHVTYGESVLDMRYVFHFYLQLISEIFFHSNIQWVTLKMQVFL
jgi:hypothetical protein